LFDRQSGKVQKIILNKYRADCCGTIVALANLCAHIVRIGNRGSNRNQNAVQVTGRGSGIHIPSKSRITVGGLPPQIKCTVGVVQFDAECHIPEAGFANRDVLSQYAKIDSPDHRSDITSSRFVANRIEIQVKRATDRSGEPEIGCEARAGCVQPTDSSQHQAKYCPHGSSLGV
jgi:hypothetical protein